MRDDITKSPLVDSSTQDAQEDNSMQNPSEDSAAKTYGEAVVLESAEKDKFMEELHEYCDTFTANSTCTPTISGEGIKSKLKTVLEVISIAQDNESLRKDLEEHDLLHDNVLAGDDINYKKEEGKLKIHFKDGIGDYTVKEPKELSFYQKETVDTFLFDFEKRLILGSEELSTEEDRKGNFMKLAAEIAARDDLKDYVKNSVPVLQKVKKCGMPDDWGQEIVLEARYAHRLSSEIIAKEADKLLERSIKEENPALKKLGNEARNMSRIPGYSTDTLVFRIDEALQKSQNSVGEGFFNFMGHLACSSDSDVLRDKITTYNILKTIFANSNKSKFCDSKERDLEELSIFLGKDVFSEIFKGLDNDAAIYKTLGWSADSKNPDSCLFDCVAELAPCLKDSFCEKDANSTDSVELVRDGQFKTTHACLDYNDPTPIGKIAAGVASSFVVLLAFVYAMYRKFYKKPSSNSNDDQSRPEEDRRYHFTPLPRSPFYQTTDIDDHQENTEDTDRSVQLVSMKSFAPEVPMLSRESEATDNAQGGLPSDSTDDKNYAQKSDSTKMIASSAESVADNVLQSWQL